MENQSIFEALEQFKKKEEGVTVWSTQTASAISDEVLHQSLVSAMQSDGIKMGDFMERMFGHRDTGLPEAVAEAELRKELYMNSLRALQSTERDLTFLQYKNPFENGGIRGNSGPVGLSGLPGPSSDRSEIIADLEAYTKVMSDERTADIQKYIAYLKNEPVALDKPGDSPEKNTDYAEYIKENLDNSLKNYSNPGDYLSVHVQAAEKHFAEMQMAQAEFYANEASIATSTGMSYTEYLASKLEKNPTYGEYICENPSPERKIAYTEYLAENLDKNLSKMPYEDYYNKPLCESLHL